MVHKSETDGVNLSPKDAKLDTLKKKAQLLLGKPKTFFHYLKRVPF